MIGYMRDAQIAAGVSREHVYDVTFLMLAGLLVVGFIANLLVRPVARKWFMSDAEVAALQADKAAMEGPGRSADIGAGGFSPVALLAWLAVGIPVAWGVWITLTKVAVLFR